MMYFIKMTFNLFFSKFIWIDEKITVNKYSIRFDSINPL